ncbi:aquaporin-9 domain protein [Oesophagostomum dentatum]|uniref:Aquaporin-9 domain protein n=1 Tax=Oesophagostomum dentatum TaxID=61180 RepID=A0A0B1SYT9_OESDE|nr:aquaporin-9 domain protein [Oesophagostomum dentatum]
MISPSPPHSPEITISKSASDVAIVHHHLDVLDEVSERQESLSAPVQGQYLNVDYPAVKLSERISVDNQADAIDLLPSQKTSVVTPRTPPFERIESAVVGTAVLCLGVAAITDRRNRIPPFLQPAYIGMLLAGIGMALALNAGYAINPARDFGPRLFTLCAGYGWRVFSYRHYKWFWVPILCPMLGALIGAWMYELFIGFHIPDDPETSYVHKILDDRNPEGQLREIHVMEKKPLSELQTNDTPKPPTQYRNM